MKQTYNHSLGINVRSHLLNLGLEKVNNLKYYNLGDNERIRAIANNIKEVNLIMGIETEELQAIEIARNIYESNKGLSYKYFPNIELKKHKGERDSNSYNLSLQFNVKDENTWEQKNVALHYNGYFRNYDVKSSDIYEIMNFFTKRPFNAELFKSQVEETIKFLFQPESFEITIFY